MTDRILFDEQQTAALIDRVTDQILSAVTQRELAEGGIIGIHRHGVSFALMMAARIREKTGLEVPVGKLDINMYRDDIGRRKKLPVINETSVTSDIENKLIILADDVLHTGRTIRAALDAITDFGRPRVIRLAVVLDRGAREVPIQADFVGGHFHVNPDEWVQLRETADGAVIGVGIRKGR